MEYTQQDSIWNIPRKRNLLEDAVQNTMPTKYKLRWDMLSCLCSKRYISCAYIHSVGINGDINRYAAICREFVSI